MTTPPLFNVSVANTNKAPTVGRENSIYNGGKSGKPVMGSRIQGQIEKKDLDVLSINKVNHSVNVNHSVDYSSMAKTNRMVKPSKKLSEMFDQGNSTRT